MTPKVTIKDFWYWVNERHQIYLRRKAKLPQEQWTADQVLQSYRFTNVFRELDRGSVVLRRIVTGIKDERVHLINCVLYRMFNSPETALLMRLPALAYPHQRKRIAASLADARAGGMKLYRGAYILKGTYARSLAIVDAAWARSQVWIEELRFINTVESAFRLFQELNGVGEFTAHQLAQDLRHGVLRSAIDGATWSSPGPGAQRCLRWMNMPPTLASMREIHADQSQRAKYVPPLEVKDIQQSLCEVQKYAKICAFMYGEQHRPKLRNFDSGDRELP